MKKDNTVYIHGKTICLLIIFFLFCNSCKKFLEIEPPNTELVTSNVFNDNTTANAALTSIYSRMANESAPYLHALLNGLSSDELINYSTQQTNIQFYVNAINSNNTLLQTTLWTPAYNYIYQANAIIDGLKAADGVSINVKNQLTGEAKFIRAFWHFNLINLFGDIPLVVETNYKTNAQLTRTAQNKVYNQIIADLNDAKILLTESYVGSDGITPTNERVRVNDWVASALLARVYLYNGDFIAAEKEASTIIENSSLFSLVSDLNEVFLKNSSESIWQLQPAQVTTEAQNFILTGSPSTGSVRNASISEFLLNAFEPGDNRKTFWIGIFADSNGTWYYPNKLKINSGANDSEYSTGLRLAEQYLIRAEARIQQDKIAEGIGDINLLRNRCRANPTSNIPDPLPSLSINLPKSNALAAVEHERQVELFAEWGHRWMDLKRTGRASTVMSIVTAQKGGSWSSNDQLYPIPQNERANNSNLTQNPGY